MQLNIHVPKAREQLVRELEDLADQSAHPKSQLVLDAIELYLRQQRGAQPAGVELPVYPTMDVTVPLRRADLYEERAERRFAGR
jgi:metal-responsive CopG/Arc/MetJ family transcriptional regulator